MAKTSKSGCIGAKRNYTSGCFRECSHPERVEQDVGRLEYKIRFRRADLQWDHYPHLGKADLNGEACVVTGWWCVQATMNSIWGPWRFDALRIPHAFYGLPKRPPNCRPRNTTGFPPHVGSLNRHQTEFMHS